MKIKEIGKHNSEHRALKATLSKSFHFIATSFPQPQNRIANALFERLFRSLLGYASQMEKLMRRYIYIYAYIKNSYAPTC